MFIYINLSEAKKSKQQGGIFGTYDTFLRIQNKKWKELGMDKACEKIKYCKAQTLSLNNNEFVRIPSSLKRIKFYSLKILMLENNSLQTVSQIYHLNMPALQRINLGHNRINKIKEVRKGHWEMLSCVSLQGNKITDMETIVNSSFSHEMDCITLQVDENEKEISCDLSWYGKVGGISLRKGLGLCRSRIKQLGLQRALKRKIEGLQVRYYKEQMHYAVHNYGYDSDSDYDHDYIDYRFGYDNYLDDSF